MIVAAGRRQVVPIEPSTPCDLALVDRLLRLHLRSRRLGWTLVLADVDDELAALLELVGVDGCLCPNDQVVPPEPAEPCNAEHWRRRC